MKKIIVSILILLFLITIYINANSNKNAIIDTNVITYQDKESYIGYLVIPKVEMNLGFYDINHPLNDVDKNIMQIETDIKNTYLFAAHSGSGILAYFNDLAKLEIDDDIYLNFKSFQNHYKVINIRREIKDGKISIANKEGMLILTTCDQLYKGYQLIIEGVIV